MLDLTSANALVSLTGFSATDPRSPTEFLVPHCSHCSHWQNHYEGTERFFRIFSFYHGWEECNTEKEKISVKPETGKSTGSSQEKAQGVRGQSGGAKGAAP